MTTSSKAIVLSLGLVCALFAVTWSATPAAARDVSFTLYVSDSDGWGEQPTSLSNPGPWLTVDEGDNVTLQLNATEGQDHRWFIDYDNDASRASNEPRSPPFHEGDASISWNFTANRNGTYVYRSQGQIEMWGLITIRPAGSSPLDLGPGGGNLLIVGAAIAIFLGVLAVAIVMGRRRRTPPPPPEEPREE